MGVYGTYIKLAFSIGMMIYNWVSAGEESDKPEPEELQINNYTRNAPVPICWGLNKYAGTIVYAEDFEIISNDDGSGGGKGFLTSMLGGSGGDTSGGVFDPYTYCVNFAVAISEGVILEFVDFQFDGAALDNAYLSHEEFLGTPTQLLPIIGNLDYALRNTAYTIFSGSVGGLNQIPNLICEIDGVDLGDDVVQLDWTVDDNMMDLLPSDEGFSQTFSDGKFLYFIMSDTGSIYKFNDLNYTMTLFINPGEISNGFNSGSNLFCESSTDDKIMYGMSYRNILSVENPCGAETYYDLFTVNKATGELNSICLNSLLPTDIAQFQQSSYSVYAVEGNRLFVNWDSNFGGFGQTYYNNEIFYFKILVIGIEQVTPFRKYVIVSGQPYVPTSAFTIVTFKRESSGNVYNCGNVEDSGMYLRLESMVELDGYLVVCTMNNASPSISVSIFSSEDGSFIYTIWVHAVPSTESFASYYSTTISRLGSEIAISFPGYYLDYYFGYRHSGIRFFLLNYTNIIGFKGYTNDFRGKCPLYGPAYLNGKYYFLFYDNDPLDGGVTKAKILEYLYTSNGFGGWIFAGSKIIFEIEINPVFYTYVTSRMGGNSFLCVYNDRLYFDIVTAPSEFSESHTIYCMYRNKIFVIDKFNAFTDACNYDDVNFVSCNQRAGLFGTSHGSNYIKDSVPHDCTPIAVCYDFLTKRYGCNLDPDLIDGDIDNVGTTFYTEHRYCLENISNSNEWESRFLYADVIKDLKKGYDIIKDILQTCRGFLYYCDGKIKVKIQKPNEVPNFYFGYDVQEFISSQDSDYLNRIYADFSAYPDDYWKGDFGKGIVDNDVIDFIILSSTSTYIELISDLDIYFPIDCFFELTKNNVKKGTFCWEKKEEQLKNNKVKLDFINRLNDYRTDTVEVFNDYSILVDNEIREQSYQMKGIKRINQAYRLAQFLLDYDTYTNYKCTFETDIIGMMMCVGNVVGITFVEMNWVGKLFRIVAMDELEDYNVKLDLIEYNGDIFVDDTSILSERTYTDTYFNYNNVSYNKFLKPEQCDRLNLFEDRLLNKVYILFSLPTNTPYCIGAQVYHKSSNMETWENLGINYYPTASVELLTEIDTNDSIIYYDSSTIYDSFPSSGSIIIDEEEIYYHGIDDVNNCFTNCQRGFNGTTSSIHLVSSYIYYKRSNLFSFNYTENDLSFNPHSFKLLSVTVYRLFADDGTPPEKSINIFGYANLTLPVSSLKCAINPLSPISENCSLMIHSSLSNGTNFYDSSFKNNTIERLFNTSYSTEQIKFSDSSIKFYDSANALSIPYSIDFDFGYGDFTIDFWLYLTNNISYGFFLSTWQTDNIYSWGIGYESYFAFMMNYSTLVSLNYPYAYYNDWAHIAYVRYGDTLSFYINGVLEDTGNVSGISIDAKYNGNGKPLTIGRIYNNFDMYAIQAYMDEIRIVKGQALWTSDFSVPTSRYGTSYDFSWRCRSKLAQAQGYGHEPYGGGLGYGGGSSSDIDKYAYYIINNDNQTLLEQGFVVKPSDTNPDGLLTYDNSLSNNLKFGIYQIGKNGIYSPEKYVLTI